MTTLRFYFVFIGVSNLIWESLHLPLYTLWNEGSWPELVFTVVHCTGGDLLIGLASLSLALLLVGDSEWPARGFRGVFVLAIGFGAAYTVFSEWLNIVVRKSWVYSELMPVVPVINTGLSPLLQWLLIPAAGLVLARRAGLASTGTAEFRNS